MKKSKWSRMARESIAGTKSQLQLLVVMHCFLALDVELSYVLRLQAKKLSIRAKCKLKLQELKTF